MHAFHIFVCEQITENFWKLLDRNAAFSALISKIERKPNKPLIPFGFHCLTTDL